MKKNGFGNIPKEGAKLITFEQMGNQYNFSYAMCRRIVEKYPSCKVKVGRSVRINVAELDKVLVGNVDI